MDLSEQKETQPPQQENQAIDLPTQPIEEPIIEEPLVENEPVVEQQDPQPIDPIPEPIEQPIEQQVNPITQHLSMETDIPPLEGPFQSVEINLQNERSVTRPEPEPQPMEIEPQQEASPEKEEIFNSEDEEEKKKAQFTNEANIALAELKEAIRSGNSEQVEAILS